MTGSARDSDVSEKMHNLARCLWRPVEGCCSSLLRTEILGFRLSSKVKALVGLVWRFLMLVLYCTGSCSTNSTTEFQCVLLQ